MDVFAFTKKRGTSSANVALLDNAVKYSDDEPKIDIYTENIGNNIFYIVNIN